MRIAAAAREETITPYLDHTHVTGGGGVRLHVVETGNPAVAPFFSSTASLNPGSAGAARCSQTWRMTIDSSRWIFADTASPTNLARAMRMPTYGLMTSPR